MATSATDHGQPGAMRANPAVPIAADGKKEEDTYLDPLEGYDSGKAEDILGLQDTDPVMNMKMYLVNNVSWSAYSTEYS
jgi:hypothetical protein